MSKIVIIALVLLLALAVLLWLGRIRRPTFLALSGLIVVIGILVLIKGSQFQTMASTPYLMPPDTITTAPVEEADWRPVLSAVGTLAAVQGVTVSAQLDGNVAAIGFQPGTSVKAGDLLVQQDVSQEQAQLRAAEATADLARINLDRSRQLLREATISQSQYDTDQANYREALAQADAIRAIIAKKTIRAPFAGRLGVRLVNLGQTLKAGDPIVSLETLDPIFVNFYLPQQDISLFSRGAAVRITGEAVPGGAALGRITAINPAVDSDTRNLQAEATLSNPTGTLRPGMFVEVSVLLPQSRKVLAIPATAVLYAPYGDSVFTVTEARDPATGRTTPTVRQVFVRLGETRGDYVEVTNGLKAGEVVVSSGVFKLRNGEPVVIDNSLAAPTQVSPHPANS